MTVKKQHMVHEGKLYYSMAVTAGMLGITKPKLMQILNSEGFDWANFRDNGPIWVSAESIGAYQKRCGNDKS